MVKLSIADYAYSLLPINTGFKTELTRFINSTKIGNFKDGFSSLNSAISQLVNNYTVFDFKGERFWPQNTYLYSFKYNFLYCPIPKNASTSMHKFILELELGRNLNPREMKGIHLNTGLKYSLQYLPLSEALRILNRPNLLKFVIVRNPWKRLVSGYLSKFVKNESLPEFAKDVVKAIYRKNRQKPDYQKGITFRQFVEYVCDTPDRELDSHWKPQYLFLGQTKFDVVAKLETIQQDFEYISDRLGIPKPLLESRNPSYKKKQNILESRDYVGTISVNEKLADVSTQDLRRLKCHSIPAEFYTPELINLVAVRYKEDISMFGYTDLSKI